MRKIFLEADVKALENGHFEVVASTGDIDRMGDIINPNGWYLENWFRNPVFLWAHDHSLPPIAKGTGKMAWVENNTLRAEGIFAPTEMGQQARTLVENEFLNTVSVGFYPLVEDKEKGNFKIGEKSYRRAYDSEIEKALNDREKGIYPEDGFFFEKQELLEVSWVNVPALPQALVTARKMNLSLMVKALESLNDSEEKAGRVLSEKNRKLIKNCIGQMNEAIVALTELHDATEPEKGNGSSEQVSNKGRAIGKRVKRRITSEEKLLKVVDKAIETLLLKSKQKNN
jgi:phage head maturation protease